PPTDRTLFRPPAVRPGAGLTSAPPQEDVVIRINRLGALAAVVVAAGFAGQASAQVIYRDRWVDQQEAKLRAEYQRDMQQQRMREQQQRMREQQDRMRFDMSDRM